MGILKERSSTRSGKQSSGLFAAYEPISDESEKYLIDV